MKEVLEALQMIDTKLDDCRYYLTINDSKVVVKELILDKLNEASKELKKLMSKIN